MALDQRADLPALKDALKGTEFYDSVDCLNAVFEQNRISTLYDLDNSPRYLTCSVCGCNTHTLIQIVRAYMEGVKEGSIVIESEPEPEPEPVEEEIVVEPEPIEEPEKVVKKSRSSRRRSKKE